LTPRTVEYQACGVHELVIEPPAAVMRTHADYYGNTMTFFAMQSAHRTLTVQARSRVTVEDATPRSSGGPPWEQAVDRANMPLDVLDFALEERGPRASGDIVAYARESFPSERPLLDGVADLTARIHREFTYDPSATTVATSWAQVFDSRRGVCQDFA